MNSKSIGAIALIGVIGLIIALSFIGDRVSEDQAAETEAVRAAAQRPAPNPDRNLYFGDLHVHTSRSFDSYLFANRLDVGDAYRFAKGDPLTLPSGEVMRISRPLDFVAITDHAESFGVIRNCDVENLTEARKAICNQFATPNLAFFTKIRLNAGNRPMLRYDLGMCEKDNDAECIQRANDEWAEFQILADQHNEPGVFTTLKAYEYSPGLPMGGKHHRNVIFRGNNLPSQAFSAFDAQTELDLWRLLEANCKEDCEFLTIPHNMNRSWGLAYSNQTIDGDIYTTEDWRLRRRSEPLAEIYQIKGASECALGLGATDEECAFEQPFLNCEDDQTDNCAFQTGFVRDGLKTGLKLEEELHFNPMQFGVIAATDTHNSNPGDTEEYDYRGGAGMIHSPMKKRLTVSRTGAGGPPALYAYSPGGLAAVWAEENTRDAIFAAMARRETYGTTGTRIRLRFHAGWNLPQEMLTASNPIQQADEYGVAMGSVLPVAKGAGKPRFFIWAEQDPLSAPLQKIQIVKGWLDQDGKLHEAVTDAICADGMTPDAETGRCPDNGARVDLATCDYDKDRGAASLKTIWTDQNYQADQRVFYYIRVLQNPTCRWSSYDANASKTDLPEDLIRTVQERAWSSPVWISPDR